MVIYIADRYGAVQTTASSDLPENKTLISDTMTDDLNSGVKTYECELIATDEIKAAAVAKNYVLADGQLYTIISDEYDNREQTISLYCEDAGLDLLNRVCGEVAKTSKTFEAWITSTLGSSSKSGWAYNFSGLDKTQQRMLEYTSTTSATERLLDILDNYDAEMYFTYDIEGLKWITRTINFTDARGQSEDIKSLYMNYDVEKITRKRNVEDLATVWVMYGKDKKPLKKLTGYASATKDIEKKGHTFQVVGNEVRCIDAIEKWTSSLDKDGRVVQYKYTNYSGATACINYAVREMCKIVDPVTTYEVALRNIYDGAQCGDQVKVLDAHNNVLLQARILELTKSFVTGSASVKLGDFKALKSSKAELNVDAISQIFTLSITSSAGLVGNGSIETVLTVTLYLNGQTISSVDELPVGHLVWYEDGVVVSDTDPRISDSGFTFSTGVLTTGHTYKCALED